MHKRMVTIFDIFGQGAIEGALPGWLNPCKSSGALASECEAIAAEEMNLLACGDPVLACRPQAWW